MAKTLKLTDPASNKVYTLEYTRATVAQMEREGFVLRSVEDRPMLSLPALFAGAFKAHHRMVKAEVIQSIFDRTKNREKLFQKLVEMYNEPIAAMLEEPEESEGNVDWATDF